MYTITITMLTALNNFGQCPWDREKTHFLGHFLEDNRSRHHFRQRECLNNNDERKKKNERGWMQRIRHDEKQWANQTHGCFSVSVLLAGKRKEKKRNSTSGKCVFADWQQQRQFPFIPNSIIFPYTHTHTHCLKADGQCWWWWSLKSGKRWWWRSRRRCFLRNTFTLLFAWNSPSLHFTLNNSKKQPFSILSPFYH